LNTAESSNHPNHKSLWNHRITWLTALSALVVVVIYIFSSALAHGPNGPPRQTSTPSLQEPWITEKCRFSPNPILPFSLCKIPINMTSFARKATYIWDVSLFNGKYYLYWGPAPAIIMAIAGLFHPIKAGDQYVVFASACGLFFVNILLLFGLWKRFFTDLPVWAFEIIIVFVGLVSPLLWSLNDPEIYEASILFGQFLLISGFYFAFIAFDHPESSTWKLTLAGMCWAVAIASRVTLILPIAFWIALFTFFTIKANKRDIWKSLLVMILPLLISLAAMGWYNWVRFDSRSNLDSIIN